MHELTWCVQFSMSVERLPDVLRGLGYVNQSHVPYVDDYVAEGRGRFVLVPKTGRVQLRLSLAVPREERARTAATLAQWVAARLASASSNTVRPTIA